MQIWISNKEILLLQSPIQLFPEWIEEGKNLKCLIDLTNLSIHEIIHKNRYLIQQLRFNDTMNHNQLIGIPTYVDTYKFCHSWLTFHSKKNKTEPNA